jgi:transcription initiation factor TFIID subunit 7
MENAVWSLILNAGDFGGNIILLKYLPMSKIFEYENQFILRVPPDVADKIDRAMITETNPDKPSDMIELTPVFAPDDERTQSLRFRFKFGEFSSMATMLDLPCVLESQKTLDFVNFFKSNDISQMIYVHPNQETLLEKVKDWRKIARKYIKKEDAVTMHYLARDGISAPTKCVRKRFYKKRVQIPEQLVKEVEKDIVKIRSELCKHRDQGDGESAKKPRKKKAASNS